MHPLFGSVLVTLWLRARPWVMTLQYHADAMLLASPMLTLDPVPGLDGLPSLLALDSAEIADMFFETCGYHFEPESEVYAPLPLPSLAPRASSDFFGTNATTLVAADHQQLPIVRWEWVMGIISVLTPPPNSVLSTLSKYIYTHASARDLIPFALCILLPCILFLLAISNRFRFAGSAEASAGTPNVSIESPMELLYTMDAECATNVTPKSEGAHVSSKHATAGRYPVPPPALVTAKSHSQPRPSVPASESDGFWDTAVDLNLERSPSVDLMETTRTPSTSRAALESEFLEAQLHTPHPRTSRSKSFSFRERDPGSPSLSSNRANHAPPPKYIKYIPPHRRRAGEIVYTTPSPGSKGVYEAEWVKRLGDRHMERSNSRDKSDAESSTVVDSSGEVSEDEDDLDEGRPVLEVERETSKSPNHQEKVQSQPYADRDADEPGCGQGRDAT
ncbi:hypothetical protein BV22DRAFT_1193587 [Leucogyrophana mollusca]|uniref:Uncharacterized protein n=1 Tax=Leucogyrophana mollusca TaxID=85980 RepID=A0ACB8BP65_9AGAM|nr:hypothetical protein BV22DRAFT_1193587 [Leucogyrophana mollusca]